MGGRGRDVNKDDGRDDVYYYGSCFVPLKAGKFDRSKCVANVVFSSLQIK